MSFRSPGTLAAPTNPFDFHPFPLLGAGPSAPLPRPLPATGVWGSHTFPQGRYLLAAPIIASVPGNILNIGLEIFFAGLVTDTFRFGLYRSLPQNDPNGRLPGALLAQTVEGDLLTGAPGWSFLDVESVPTPQAIPAGLSWAALLMDIKVLSANGISTHNGSNNPSLMGESIIGYTYNPWDGLIGVAPAGPSTNLPDPWPITGTIYAGGPDDVVGDGIPLMWLGKV